MHPLLLSLFGSYFTLFPIHTTLQQVEAFHLIVLEHCCSIINKVMDEGRAVAVTNCVGVCSVLLEQMIHTFLTSEAALYSVHAIMNVLNKLVKYEILAFHSLVNTEHSFLTTDTAHIANSIASAVLQVSFAGVHPIILLIKGIKDL